ncbi:AAA family ATPase [Sanguibacter suarezii]|uniref:AAA family ATPase n=1 Tax=Sanguibacter suarezii TaxID=60921 RepID=UPI00082E097C|nr:SMC family ATPase [Sanguibacter suarezii]
MHLHSMTLQAIGPFAGTHTVDFAALSEAGLFLLEGPTGAGKSTLIDAVVFALYGKVASAAASDDRLRSAYAADATESFVDLTFETGAGIYRVVRTPERLRPKKRGEGTTKQQAGITLWALTVDELAAGLGAPGDSGRLVSNRLDEAGAELTRIIGLDRSQFVQTIVLPQGEFANFLRANPEDRRGLLQKVFGTEIYEKAQAQLASMRAAAHQQLSAARSQVTSAVENFITTTSLPGPDAEILRGAGTHDVPKLADEHVAGLVSVADARDRADTAARVRLTAARVALDEAKQLTEAAARREALLTEQAALDSRTQQVQELETLLVAARRAAMVEPSITAEEVARRAAEDATERLRADLERAQQVLDVPAALAALADAGRVSRSDDELASREEARATLRRGRDDDAGQIALLNRLLPIEAGLAARRSAQTEAVAALAGQRAAITDLETDLAARPAARLELESARDAARALAADLPARTSRRAAAGEVVETFARLDTLTAEHDAALEARTAAGAVAQRAVEVEGDLRRARIAGIAGEIAASLHPGAPCPVCGSAEHPEPASRGADHVDQEAVDRAEAERRDREGDLVAAGQLVVRLAERLTALRELVAGTDLAAATAELTAAEDAVAAAEAAQQQATAAAQDLAAFDEATVRLRADHAARVEQAVTDQARLDHDATVLLADEAEISAAAGTRTVAEVVADLTARVSAVDALLTSQDHAATAWSGHRERHVELEQSLVGNHFDDVGAAREAMVPPERTSSLEQEIMTHRAACERVRSGLAEDRIIALADDIDIDLEAVRTDESTAEAAVHEAQVAAALAGRTVQDAEREAAAIARASAHLESVEVTTEPVVRMADLAGGTSPDNTTRLTLATFVLMRRFEDVVAAANSRIETMSDGRYELVRSDLKEVKGNTKVGLALRVLDHQTGLPRLPSSLSGGETFYVSLCLALGMADVVTAEAGGVDLGTLFVDEGFGSLDPETLDSVLAILGRLRAGGRVVGVVSHVEALKQTISDGISVRRLPDGSSTLTVRAG